MNIIRLSIILAVLTVGPQVYGATLIKNGVPNFDISLGTLTRVSVTVDPLPRSTYSAPAIIPGGNEPIALHHHQISFPSIFVLDRWAVFAPADTEEVEAPGGVHFHVYDVSPVNLIFEGGDEANFIAYDPFRPSGVFMRGITTTAVEGHSHDTPDIGFTFHTEATTTFEYVPFNVPEPTALVSWIVATVALVMTRRQRG